MDEGRCDFCSLLTHILIGKLYCSLLNRLKDGASSRLSLSQLLKSRSTILLKAPIHQGTRLEDFPGKPLNLRSALRAAVNSRAFPGAISAVNFFKRFYNERYLGAFFLLQTSLRTFGVSTLKIFKIVFSII